MRRDRDAPAVGGKVGDTEKITINLGPIDLGQIDLLVGEGFYSNRTDFIRTAIRNLLARHDEAVRKTIERRQIDLGIRRYSRAELEAVVLAGEMLAIEVLGLVVLDPDVSPDLATAAIGSLHILGVLQASPAVKAALKSRMS